jgi:tripeptide aminopeptidase
MVLKKTVLLYPYCMPDLDLSLDTNAAIARLMRFLAIEGITGKEEAIGREVVKALVDAGVPRKMMHFDKANEKIPLSTETGNLIVMLPGTNAGPRRLFATHLDTVPLCAGAKPVRRGNKIAAAGRTALGGDNRTGVGTLVTMVAELLSRRLPHCPLTVLFTVREESGLWGARFVDKAELGHPVLGFNVDGGSAKAITVGAVGAERWSAAISGKAAHAGVHPERGISATMVASLALADAHKNGWFGKVSKNGLEGSANVGSIGDANGKSAGQATNVVTDFALVHGEARSHEAKFVRSITSAFRDAFKNAARQVTDHNGKSARVKFQSRLDYFPFRLQSDAPVVRTAVAAVEALGWEPMLRVTNGGLDANWLVRHGVPTITFGAGQNNVHTVEEFVHVPEYLDGCRLALMLAVSS